MKVLDIGCNDAIIVGAQVTVNKALVRNAASKDISKVS
jgi:hypothetical protein